MSDNQVEDILVGDNPRERLRKTRPGAIKQLATRVLSFLNSERSRSLDASEHAELWNRIELTTTRSIARKKTQRRLWLTAAASIIATASVALWLYQEARQPEQRPIALAALAKYSLLRDTGAIKLSGHDAQTMVINEEGVIDLAAIDLGRDTQLQTNHFTTLTVPYGKRKELMLPDGSKVWLNAGSQLTFPERFEANKREVYLEGEGYFDVQPNADAPFLVVTEDFLVKVLGTSFNVSSYRDDPFASTVLISGKITLEGIGIKGFEPKPITPGNTVLLERKTKHLRVQKADVEDYISWTHKQLILKQTPRSELLVRLGRVYNTKIVEKQSETTEDTFSGRLDLTQPLEDLLTIIYDQQKYNIPREERRFIIQKK